MGHLIADVLTLTRRSRRHPLFFLGAAALVALAIGGAAAMFTLVRAVILRPLPVAHGDRAVSLHVVREGTPRGAFTLPMFLDLAAARTVDATAAWFQWSANLTDAGDAERLQGMRATGNYLETLGATVALGRAFTAADGRADSAALVVISHGLWQRRFGGASDAVGRTIRLNGEVFTVAGVLSPDFPFPLRDAEVIAPWAPDTDARRSNAALSFLRVIGRLAPGATLAQAAAEVEQITGAHRAKYPDATAGDLGARVVGLREDLVGSSARVLWMLAGAVALLLLIAWANLTNLLLVNGAGRLQEFAARRALGASAHRLVAQLSTESAVLAIAGAAFGLVMARLAIAALLAASTTPLPRAAEIGLDASAVMFALGTAPVLSIAAALLPALQVTFASASGTASQRAVTLGGRRLRAAFVCAEVALSVLLVIWGGLLVRSFVTLQRIEPGFEASNVLSVRLSLPRARYKATADLARFTDLLAPRIRSVAGVSGVAAANVVPMNGWLASATIQPPGLDSRPAAEWPDAHYRMVSPDYLDVMGIPLIRGRRFRETDGATAPAVAIISEGLARRYWPDRDPIGTPLRVRDDASVFRAVEIVGIAGDVRHLGLEAESPLEIYVPIAQVPNGTSVWLANNMYWVVKTQGAPLSYAASVRREIAAIDPEVAASFVRSMDQWLEQSVDARRFNLRVIVVFAITALTLAAIGIYSVAAEAVVVRTREIGVRSALGATHAQLTRTIMTGGLGPVLAGGALGTVSALALTSAVQSFLYGVPARDAVTYVTVFLLVAAVGTIALYVPARRVTRIDPVEALRQT